MEETDNRFVKAWIKVMGEEDPVPDWVKFDINCDDFNSEKLREIHDSCFEYHDQVEDNFSRFVDEDIHELKDKCDEIIFDTDEIFAAGTTKNLDKDGNLIYKGTFNGIQKIYKYKFLEPIVIKCTTKEDEFDYQHYIGKKRDYHVYINNYIYLNKIYPIDGEINNVVVIIILEDERKKEYCLLVKSNDYHRCFETFLDETDTSIERCAVKGIEKEIGLRLREENLIKIEDYNHSINIFDEDWDSTMHIFYYKLSMSKKNIEEFSKAESNKFYLMTLKMLKNEDHPKVADHHLFDIKKYFGLLKKDEKRTFSTLTEFNF